MLTERESVWADKQVKKVVGGVGRKFYTYTVTDTNYVYSHAHI